MPSPLMSNIARKLACDDAKLNVDENPNVAFRYSIRGIPTLLLFKGGQIVEQIVGLADKDSLKKLIDKHV